jgi:hypothetical protein
VDPRLTRELEVLMADGWTVFLLAPAMLVLAMALLAEGPLA